MTLADSINRMIESILQASTWTSAGGKNPVENFIKQLRGVETPELEGELNDLVGGIGGGDKDEVLKKQKEVQANITTVKAFTAGNVGKLNQFTSKQFGNVRGLATNPMGFMVKSLGRLAKGGIAITLVFLFMTIIQFAIEELMKPGRPLDRRFKRLASREIEIFTLRQEQAELNLGIKTLIVTTKPGLRGGQGQVSGNLYSAPLGIQRNFYDTRLPALEDNQRAQGVSKGSIGGGAGFARSSRGKA